MTWGAQVWHVMKKDLGQQWKLELATVVISALLVLVAPQLAADDDVTPFVATFGMFALQWLLVVAWVQGDAPTAPNAAFRVLPLSPTAVLTAKVALVLALCVVMAPLGAIAIARLGVYGTSMISSVGIGVLSSLTVLTIPLLIGMTTVDVGGAILTLIGLIVLTSLFNGVSAKLLGSTAEPVALDVVSSWGVILTTFVALLLIASRLYTRSRDASWIRAAIVTCAFLAFPLLGRLAERIEASRLRTLDVEQRPVTLTPVLFANVASVEHELVFRDVSPLDRVVLDSGTVQLRFPDGSVATAGLGDFSGVSPSSPDKAARQRNRIIAHPSVIPGTSMRWPDTRGSTHIATRVPVTSAQLAFVRSGRVSATISGAVHTAHVQPMGTFNPHAPDSAAGAGWRIRSADSAATWWRSYRYEIAVQSFWSSDWNGSTGGVFAPYALLVDSLTGDGEPLMLSTSTVAGSLTPTLGLRARGQLFITSRDEFDLSSVPPALLARSSTRLRLFFLTAGARYRFSATLTPTSTVSAAAVRR